MGRRLKRFVLGLGKLGFTLISNPAHIITVVFEGMLGSLVRAEIWLDEDSKYKGRKAQKAANFFCGALNWLIVKRLKVTAKLICFLWSKSGGALDKAITRFQNLACGKDDNGAKRSIAKKIWYGLVSAFLSAFSVAVILFPVFTIVLRFKPFVAVVNWFHKIGKALSDHVNQYFSGRDTDDVLVTANIYSIKEVGLIFINFAVELCCLIGAGCAALSVLAFRKVFGKKNEKLEVKPAEKSNGEDAKKSNRLIQRFDAETAYFKTEWRDGKKGTVVLRIILNPAVIIGLIIAGINKALVTAVQKCASNGFGRFINLLVLERLQLLVQLVHYAWSFLGGGLGTTLDNCISRMTDSNQKLSKRIFAGICAFSLSAFSWLIVIEPYVGVLLGFAKALPVVKLIVKFGNWLHGGVNNMFVFQRLNTVMSWSGLYPIRLLGRVIAASAIYIWAFAVSTVVFKVLNKCFGFKRKGPDVGIGAIVEDAGAVVGGVTPGIPGADGAEGMVTGTMEAEESSAELKHKFRSAVKRAAAASAFSASTRGDVDNLSKSAEPGHFSTSTAMMDVDRHPRVGGDSEGVVVLE